MDKNTHYNCAQGLVPDSCQTKEQNHTVVWH